MNRSIRRIYSETLPFEELLRAETLALLVRYRLELVLAVRPWDLPELPRVLGILGDAGVAVSVWPMVEDAVGRWASTHNAAPFADFARRVTEQAKAAGLADHALLLDLEPPFEAARSLTEGWGGMARAGAALARGFSGPGEAYHRGRAHLQGLVHDLRLERVPTSLAVWPLVMLDEGPIAAWQRVLGTPVDLLKADRVSVMMYSTIFEGWSRGTLTRVDATSLLYRGTKRAVRRYGERASVSVGCVGTGAFADEPVYRSPAELEEDVRIARAAGCDDLSLFDLAGVLARPPPEAWLDAFCASEAGDEEPLRIVTPSPRAEAARTTAHLATWILSRLSR